MADINRTTPTDRETVIKFDDEANQQLFDAGEAAWD